MMAGIIVLDSLDTSFTEGTLQLSSYTRIHSDDPLEPERYCIRTTWVYTGQDMSQDLPDGMCESVIWGEDGSVFGFSRYAPKTSIMTD